MGSERRKLARVPIVTEVECTPNNLLLPTRDLSVGGLFLQTKESLPHGTKLQLRFYLDQKVLISAEGEVVYVAPGLGVGIEFTELPASQKQAIEGFVGSQPNAGEQSESGG